RAVQPAAEGDEPAPAPLLGHLLAVEEPRLHRLVLGPEDGQDVGLAEIGVLPGDVGGDILNACRVAGYGKDAPGLGRGHCVHFGSPLDCGHEAPPLCCIWLSSLAELAIPHRKTGKRGCQPVCAEGFHCGAKVACTIVELGFTP
ncbi:MAG: hypothetical protein D3908_15680, partial [Candidatus Electrothrix sp. AUS4]|nr:hypothetical protein [Candidatus Electrothrix sp. AUS4]